MDITVNREHIFTDATREITLDGPEVGTLNSLDAGTITSPFRVDLRYIRNDNHDWLISADVSSIADEQITWRRRRVVIPNVDYCDHSWLIRAAYQVHPDGDFRPITQN